MLPAYAPLQNTDAQVPTLTPVSVASEGAIESSVSTHDPLPTPAKTSKWSLRGVRHGRVLLTLNQLAVMSQNGIELADAIETVSRNCQDERLAETLNAIHGALSGGQSLSHAVAIHGKHFPATLAPMLAAAEASGDVPETLGRICHRMRGELQMRGTIVGAMIYPVILVGASTVVMGALVLGVLPQFAKVFASMGKPVPIYTQTLLSIGEFAQAHWLGILIAALSMSTLLFMMRGHRWIQGPIHRFLMFGPLIRDAYRPLQAGRVLRTIAAMVQGGVPLMQAVQLAKQTTRDVYWQQLLDRIERDLIDGLPASNAMMKVTFIPPETAQLMVTAERSGKIAEVLEDVGAFYEEEAERRIKRLVVALEPAIIVIMGVLVAGIVMSVMLPLLDVSTIG
ncbi:MAG: type II secretion system F family protein [Rubripirellula sp.]